ncbi:MAG: 2-phospho-L-lactate transferase [Terriglobales bacterium]
MITVLTGGTGGAKFVDGLRQTVPQDELTIIVNTGDDLRWWGLYVSPDVDSITYVLAGKLSQERGWGFAGDTFFCLKTMAQMGEPNWFRVGDRDLALHIFRSRLLAEGRTLSEATTEIAARLGIKSRILPMSNSRIETRILTPAGELSFEEYFVRRRYRDPVESVRFAGASESEPALGVLEAIRSAEFVVLAPSNPVTSIGPILAVPGIRQALRETHARIAAISPIVGRAAVTGPAGVLLASQGFAVSIAGVADFYRDFLDLLVVDSQDAPAAGDLLKKDLLKNDFRKNALRKDELRHNRALGKTGLQICCAPTIMRKNNNGDRVALAKSVIAACQQLPETQSVAERA